MYFLRNVRQIFIYFFVKLIANDEIIKNGFEITYMKVPVYESTPVTCEKHNKN